MKQFLRKYDSPIAWGIVLIGSLIMAYFIIGSIVSHFIK